MKKNIFLTGATSFLGSHLLKNLIKTDYALCATAQRERKDEHIISVDLRNINEIREHVSSPDIVIHAGAFVDLSRDFEIGKKCFDVNTVGTMNLLESVKQSRPRFIYISSEEVYGNSSLPFQENQRIQPPSPYAISKASAEDLCLWYGKEYNFPVYIIRLGTFYGPGQPLQKYFTQTVMHALKNEPIPCNSGIKKRDYIYIDDAINLIMTVVHHSEKKLPINTIINGTGGISYRLLDVIELIKQLTQSSSEVKIGAIPDRITERDEWLSDISYAKELLGWEPTIGLEEGLKRMIAYFKQN